MEVVNVLLRSLFLAFIVWTAFWALTKKEKIVGYEVKEIDHMAVRTAILLGIFHMVILISNSIQVENGVSVSEEVRGRAFGRYWFGFWMYPFVYFGLTQFLWINRIRRSRVVRIAIALGILIVMNFEKMVILLTSFHRDFL